MKSVRLAFVLLLSSVAVYSQTPLATVTGLATDPAGAVVPNAGVTLVNTGTSTRLTAKTNDAGLYTFPNLQPGSYTLSAEAKGFARIDVEAFPLDAFRTMRQDLKFAVASASTSVTVAASAASVIQLDTPSIGSSMTNKQLVELPTNLRSVMKNSGDSGLISGIMPLTVPGVQQVANGASWITPGAQAVGVKVKVDGIETTFGNFGFVDNVSQPSMESLEEFTANVMTNRAEFGGVSSITSVTKSGTNDFHGSVFYYVRNSALDARNTFQTARAFTNLHNYGATVSGPVFKEKTFFTFTFDGARGVDPYTVNASVPTVAQRSGDFSAFAALKNPFTGQNPYQGNVILPSFLSPQALKLQQQFYPLPNYGGANLTTNNFRAFYTGPQVHRGLEARVDHNFSATQRAFLRYQNRWDDYEIPGARSVLPPMSVGTSTNNRGVHFFTAGDTLTLSPSLFNEFRVGAVILRANSDNPLKGQALLDAAGITGLPSRGTINGMPAINPTGFSAVSESLLNPVNDGHFQIADNLTWVRGRHTMKFGGEYAYWFVNRYLTTASGLFGAFAFTGTYTGNAWADFLMGLPNTVTRLDPYPAQYARYTTLAFFAQDDYKVNSRLTLSYGLRYEYYGPVTARDDNFYSFDLSNGKLIIPSQNSKRLVSPYFPSTLPLETAADLGLDRSLRNADKNNFAPRFGFSYLLDSAGKTVVRGGYGFYYNPLSANVTSSLSTGPFAVSTTATNSFATGSPAFTLANPFALPGSAGTIAVNGITPNLLNAYVQQYSLSVERALAKDIGVRVSYIGSKATQLIYKRNANQPPRRRGTSREVSPPFPIRSRQTKTIGYARSGSKSGIRRSVGWQTRQAQTCKIARPPRSARSRARRRQRARSVPAFPPYGPCGSAPSHFRPPEAARVSWQNRWLQR